MREQLERLVEEMVTKGIRYEDAQREFEKRFIAQVLAKADGNLGRAVTNTRFGNITTTRYRFSAKTCSCRK